MSSRKELALQINGSITDLFEIIKELYHGSSSIVYLGKYRKTGKIYAIKKLYWTFCPPRYFQEFKILRMCNNPNIIQGSRLFYKNNEEIYLILQYFEHVPFPVTLNSFTPKLIYYYMKSLLNGLAYLHSKKIIHRNVKPTNFLFNPTLFTGKLIGFQNSCFEELKTVNSEEANTQSSFPTFSVGTHGYKPPEVLLKSEVITTAVDVWSAGVILLTILTRRYPFFTCHDDLDSLCQIANIIGTEKLKEAAIECHRQIVFPFDVKTTDLKLIVIAYNPRIFDLHLPDTIFDLLSKMLDPFPSKRITALEAIHHPYFTNVKTA